MSDEPFAAYNAAWLRQASGFLTKSVANCEDQNMDERLLRSNTTKTAPSAASQRTEDGAPIPFATLPGNRRIGPLRDTKRHHLSHQLSEYSALVNGDPFDGQTLDANNKSQYNSRNSVLNSPPKPVTRTITNFYTETHIVPGDGEWNGDMDMQCDGRSCVCVERSFDEIEVGRRDKSIPERTRDFGKALAALHYAQTAASVRQLSKTTQNPPHTLPLDKILRDNSLHPVGDAKISTGVFRGDVVTTQFPSIPSSAILSSIPQPQSSHSGDESTSIFSSILSSIPFASLPIRGYPHPATWTKPKLWYEHDYNEFVQDVPLLWPEMGHECRIVLEVGILEWILVESRTGFWIAGMWLDTAAFVASTWEETCPRIQKEEWLKGLDFKEPTEENLKKRRAAEVKRFQEPIGAEQLAQVEEILRAMRASWAEED